MMLRVRKLIHSLFHDLACRFLSRVEKREMRQKLRKFCHSKKCRPFRSAHSRPLLKVATLIRLFSISAYVDSLLPPKKRPRTQTKFRCNQKILRPEMILIFASRPIFSALTISQNSRVKGYVQETLSFLIRDFPLRRQILLRFFVLGSLACHSPNCSVDRKKLAKSGRETRGHSSSSSSSIDDASSEASLAF